MLTYTRKMTDDEVIELYEKFFSKDWRVCTIDPSVLGWAELNFKKERDTGYVICTVWLHPDRVYAGVILSQNGFSVA